MTESIKHHAKELILFTQFFKKSIKLYFLGEQNIQFVCKTSTKSSPGFQNHLVSI